MQIIFLLINLSIHWRLISTLNITVSFRKNKQRATLHSKGNMFNEWSYCLNRDLVPTLITRHVRMCLIQLSRWLIVLSASTNRFPAMYKLKPVSAHVTLNLCEPVACYSNPTAPPLKVIIRTHRCHTHATGIHGVHPRLHGYNTNKDQLMQHDFPRCCVTKM